MEVITGVGKSDKICKDMSANLSQVILCVEEVFVLRQVNHLFDIVFSLMDNGQVEQPVEKEEKTKPFLVHTQNTSKNECFPQVNN